MKKTLLCLSVLVLALSYVPPGEASHDGCAGDPDVVAVCGWHHGPYPCYAFYANGEHISGMDVC